MDPPLLYAIDLFEIIEYTYKRNERCGWNGMK